MITLNFYTFFIYCLLLFILGYYFGRKSKNSKRKTDNEVIEDYLKQKGRK